MIDFHTHILPNLDDGAKSIEETFTLIKEAKEAGFTKIISTTHYFEGYYESNNIERKTWIDNLNSKIEDVKLYLGNEIFISDKIIEFIKENKAATIGNSKYVLFELPMNNKPMNLKETIYKLQDAGYVPIIAHPERYAYIQENPNLLVELIEMGALFQANYGSIIGVYGNKPKEAIKKLLKNNMIHFLGTDVHRPNSIYVKMPLILSELKKVISEDTFKKLSLENAQKVLDNQDIDIETPKKIKINFLSQIFK